MKGNQGLEALAALCGGASKADESSKQQPASSPVLAPAPAAGTPVTAPWAISRGMPVQASTAGVIAPAPRTGAPPADAFATTLQQQNAIIQAAAGLIPAAATATAAAAMQSDPVQQLAYYHFVQAQAAAAASQLSQQQGASPAAPLVDPKTAVALAVAAQQAQQKHATSSQPDATSRHATQNHQQQILPAAAPATSQTNSGGTSSMQPPAPQVPTRTNANSSSSTSTAPLSNAVPIAAAPPKVQPASTAPIIKRQSFESDASASVVTSHDDKKQLKRAANRRSAQLSRKRKKQFIEELKEENDELRRKEQILRSIPDLIVVFDSAGKLWFVSHSVRRFLEFSTQELEGSSFWDRLCDESVRLLKAAFMDALAARSDDSATVPLGSGVWELRLVDKDGSHKLVTLNGVVHFSGETPECVCSIRPREVYQNHLKPLLGEPVEKKARVDPSSAASSSSSSKANRTAGTDDVHFQPNLVRDAIKPQQSVISNGSSDDVSVKIARGRAPAVAPAAAVGGTRRTAQISDGESVVSESGSGSGSD